MFEVIEINESKNIMKSINAIIYGTIRDIEEHFLKSFTNIDLLCNFFNNVCIIIFENDSLDNTRNLLRQWSSYSNANIVKHVILEDNLNSRFPLRAHRLAYCRNQILNYIFDNNLENHYQYALHCDLDDRFWCLDYNSICNCFQYDVNSWDAMFPINTSYTYYDFWALRCNQTWFNKNIFSCKIENNDKYNEYENHISDLYGFLKNNKNRLISVNSAFNGLGIYKLESLKNCRYNADYYCSKCKGQSQGCLEDNDHIGLHNSMISNNCKLFINPKMVLEYKLKEYISYSKFVSNLKNIPTIQKDLLKYVLYSKIVKKEQNQVWLIFSEKCGTYENIISNFTTNNMISFCIHDNDNYSNALINNNVTTFIGNANKVINHYILHHGNDSEISLIHIDFNDYHNTITIFEKLHKRIMNECIIVFNKVHNVNDFIVNDLHAFYEYTQKYNIHFEYIGINDNTNVAIKIINNPYLSKIERTNDLYEYEDEYINFDWMKYVQMYNDIHHVTRKAEAWDHWLFHGKNEGREYYTNTDNQTTTDNQTNTDNQTTLPDPTFHWKKYVKKNDDLKHILSEEEAWHHWINYGKNEGRKYYNKSKYEATTTEDFDWKYYINSYEDLKNISTKEEAWHHWITYGKNEGRIMVDKKCLKFSNFDWKYYVKINEDLQHISSKEEAWKHWINYGKNENRLFKKKNKKENIYFNLNI